MPDRIDRNEGLWHTEKELRVAAPLVRSSSEEAMLERALREVEAYLKDTRADW